MVAKRRVTSHEVAERAGVSRTTVSFVLNEVEGAQISEETRQRVLRAAHELGYVPDAAARTLASGRTRILGLIIRFSFPDESRDLRKRSKNESQPGPRARLAPMRTEWLLRSALRQSGHSGIDCRVTEQLFNPKQLVVLR